MWKRIFIKISAYDKLSSLDSIICWDDEQRCFKANTIREWLLTERTRKLPYTGIATKQPRIPITWPNRRRYIANWWSRDRCSWHTTRNTTEFNYDAVFIRHVILEGPYRSKSSRKMIYGRMPNPNSSSLHRSTTKRSCDAFRARRTNARMQCRVASFIRICYTLGCKSR